MFTKHFNTRQTPQSEPIPGSPQVPNNAGGYCFAVDDWTRLERFLILGSAGGSYYVSERKLTIDNAQAVVVLIKQDGVEVVRRAVNVSVAGRAPKNDPAIFVLALAAAFGDQQTRQTAYQAMPEVCRTGTYLFQFAEFCNDLRGWGAGLRRAIASWYTGKSAQDVAYQVTKYQNRNGWSHRDLLRLAHPKLDPESDLQAIAHWVVKGWPGVGDEPHPQEALRIIWAMERAKTAASEEAIVRLIHDYQLVRECIPTTWLNSPAVWEALLAKMPVTALVRNLGKMTAVGLVKPLSAAAARVVQTLNNVDALKKARIHPLSLLVALKTYAQGHGDKGALKWQPVQQVVDALDAAFYSAFGAVEPTNKRWLLALDVSGSMSAAIAGMPLDCRTASAAMALVTAAVERTCFILGFSAASGGYGGQWGGGDSGLTPVNISPKTRLDKVVQEINRIPMGGTDCSLPMRYALDKRLEVDAFVVYTDNETWAGRIHPVQALRQYREKTGIPARLLVVGMTSSGFTIADPEDRGMLDLAGFDTSAPAVMSGFVRGEF